MCTYEHKQANNPCHDANYSGCTKILVGVRTRTATSTSYFLSMASRRAYSQQFLAKDDVNACFQAVAAARPQLLRELDFELENAREVLAWFSPVYCDCKPQTDDMEKATAILAAWRASAGQLQDDWSYTAHEALASTKETMVEKLQELGPGIGRKALELRSAVRWLDAIEIHCTPYFQGVFLGASVALKDLLPQLGQIERMLQKLVDV